MATKAMRDDVSSTIWRAALDSPCRDLVALVDDGLPRTSPRLLFFEK